MGADDDGDTTDGDGMVIDTSSLPGGGNLQIAANSFLVFAGTDQTQWEAEYGPLIAGASFFNVNDAGLQWQALNNSGDSISFGNAAGLTAANTGFSYADVNTDGETILWDAATMTYVDGGMVSIHPDCGPQTYVPGTASAAAAVPEPGTAGLILAFGVAMISRRRR